MIFIFIINLDMKELNPIKKFGKNKKKIKIVELQGGPSQGTPYLGFQIEIQKTPRLSLE